MNKRMKTACWAGLAFAAMPAAAQIYVAPNGDDAHAGTQAQPVRTLERARDLARQRNRAMTSDLTVYLAPGVYRLTRPLELAARDSGSGGHNVVWSAASASEMPVISGGLRVTGWKLADAARNLWTAPAPEAFRATRQIYVDGVRAHRTRGRLPVSVTPNESGYTASSDAMAKWRNPTGIEFVYTGGNSIWNEHSQGLGPWTEPRCPVAAIRGDTIEMAQPCWNNSTKRVMLQTGERTANLVGPASVGKQPAYVENAYELLGRPGEWYFDPAARTFYYTPRPGEDMARADIEAPAVETLIKGVGTAGQPIHNIVFRGIQFSYATWMAPSSREGFSEIQASYTLTGEHGWDRQGLCKLAPEGACPYGAWTKAPGNVSFHFGHNIEFRGDAFVHLGAAGLDLGDGAQGDLVEGSVFTDISGNGLELSAVDRPDAPVAAQTRDTRIRNNHFWNIGAEYRGGIAIVVGYSYRTSIEHNQIDHTPYAAISMGWGGWPDKIKQAGVSNYSAENVVAHNRISNFMLVLADGGGIYTQGLTGPDLAHGERVTGNLVYDQFGSGHAIYTDNGSCNITVEGNIVFHTNFDNWGSRHKDYYDGAQGKTNDPLAILGNYWQQDATDASRDDVSVTGNHLISELSQAPQKLLDDAGIEAEFRSILSKTFEKAPPEAPSRIAALAINGGALVTWSPPVFEGGAPVDSYVVTASDGTKATITGRDFWDVGYVKAEGLKNGAEYAFTVAAVNANGTSVASEPSRPVKPSEAKIDPPAAPGNVRIYADGNGMVSIHLQDPAAAKKELARSPVLAYRITVRPVGGSEDRTLVFRGRNVLALEGTTHTTFTVMDGLKPGESYTFAVSAVNAGGEGEAVVTDPIRVVRK